MTFIWPFLTLNLHEIIRNLQNNTLGDILSWYNHRNNLWTIFPYSWHCVTYLYLLNMWNLYGFVIGHQCHSCFFCSNLGKLQESQNKIWQTARKSQEVRHNPWEYATILVNISFKNNAEVTWNCKNKVVGRVKSMQECWCAAFVFDWQPPLIFFQFTSKLQGH